MAIQYGRNGGITHRNNAGYDTWIVALNAVRTIGDVLGSCIVGDNYITFIVLLKY